jgi:hypothetical protein
MAKGRNRQLRLPGDLAGRIEALAKSTGLAQSDVLRMAIRAGLGRLESGEFNPFGEPGETEAREGAPRHPPAD